MSLASASPRRASLDSDIILISTSPLPASPRPPAARSRHRHHALQPPATAAAGALPPARSSSPRHHAHVSSAPPNPITSPPRHLNNPLSPSRHRRPRQHSPSQHGSVHATAATAAALSDPVAGSPLQTRSSATSYDRRSFLDELLGDGIPSSPTYPSLRSPPSLLDDDIYQDDSNIDSHVANTTQTSDCMGRANNAAADVPDSPSQQLQAGPSANTTQNTDFSLPETQYSPIFNDLTDDQGATETASTSFSENMSATLRRGNSDMCPRPKRRRGSPAERRLQLKHEPVKPLDPDEDLFGDSPKAPTVPKDAIDDEDLTTIDLTEATEVPAELKKPIVDNRIKIAAFQCAICMDDVTGLTVTYCGHLFCAQCLHHSLDVESTKGKCPMCRSKIDMKARESYSSKTKGFWPLELKLMTTTRKGKRKADDISK